MTNEERDQPKNQLLEPLGVNARPETWDEATEGTTEETLGIPQPFPSFQTLRVLPWEPRFHWVGSLWEAAWAINLPHEDFPERVPDTRRAIRGLLLGYPVPHPITQEQLLQVHRTIFGDTPHAGTWRDNSVTVALHVPPAPHLLPSLMRQLEQAYRHETDSIERLRHWYSDFETIHPFQDGNGRVGGVVIASLSHIMPDAMIFGEANRN